MQTSWLITGVVEELNFFYYYFLFKYIVSLLA